MSEPDVAPTVPQNAHRFELVGPLDELELPDVCAACGAKAAGTIDIRKVFVDTTAGEPRHVLGEVRVPFCRSCIALHERERAQLPRMRAYRFPPLRDFGLASIWLVLGVLFMFIGFAVGTGGGTLPALILTYLAVASLAFWAVAMRRASRVPWFERVPPQTSVTSAFDFGEATSGPQEQSRRRYAIRDAVFAERFSALNAERLPTGRKRIRARWRVIAILVVIAAIAAAVIIWGPLITIS